MAKSDIDQNIGNILSLMGMISVPAYLVFWLNLSVADKSARFYRSFYNAYVERYGHLPESYIFNGTGDFKDKWRFNDPLD